MHTSTCTYTHIYSCTHTHRRCAAEAAERARVLEDFHQRRKAAAANKLRGQAQWLAPSPPLPAPSPPLPAPSPLPHGMASLQCTSSALMLIPCVRSAGERERESAPAVHEMSCNAVDHKRGMLFLSVGWHPWNSSYYTTTNEGPTVYTCIGICMYR